MPRIVNPPRGALALNVKRKRAGGRSVNARPSMRRWQPPEPPPPPKLPPADNEGFARYLKAARKYGGYPGKGWETVEEFAARWGVDPLRALGHPRIPLNRPRIDADGFGFKCVEGAEVTFDGSRGQRVIWVRFLHAGEDPLPYLRAAWAACRAAGANPEPLIEADPLRKMPR